VGKPSLNAAQPYAKAEGRVFLLVPAYPGCPGTKAVKRLLLSFSNSYGARRHCVKGKHRCESHADRDHAPPQRHVAVPGRNTLVNANVLQLFKPNETLHSNRFTTV